MLISTGMKTQVIVIVGLILLFARPGNAQPQNLRLATLEWHPYTGTNLPNGGLATKIVSEAFADAGYAVDISCMAWSRVMSASKSNRFDAIYPAYFSESRMTNYFISEPILAGPLVFCARDGVPRKYDSLKDLKNYRIGVVHSYVNSETFDQADFLNKIAGESDFANMKLLAQGKLDIVVIDKLVATSMIRKNTSELGSLKEYIFLTPRLGMRDMYVMFPRNNKSSMTRLEDFNKALEKMREKGRIEKILKKRGFR
jgi:polar amino acid transport system substrate-binding protein